MAKKQTDAPEPQPKYVMPPAQSDLFSAYGGGLMRLRDVTQPGENPPLVFLVEAPLGANWTWTDARWFEACCLESKAIRDAVAQVKQHRYSKTSIEMILRPAIQKFFEETFLVDIIKRFDHALPSLAAYFTARQAYYDLHPEELDEDSVANRARVSE